MFSEKNPNESKIKVLDEKTVIKIAADFAPYLSSRVQPPFATPIRWREFDCFSSLI